jgi:hypothetical protein
MPEREYRSVGRTAYSGRKERRKGGRLSRRKDIKEGRKKGVSNQERKGNKERKEYQEMKDITNEFGYVVLAHTF